MAKFMIQASYNAEGAFYFAFGEDDAVLLVDAPDNASALAAAMTAAAGGALARIKTTVLLTPEEIDAAAKKTVSYSAPGR